MIIHNTHLLPIADATAGYGNATVPADENGNISWPAYNRDELWQMDLNTAGGIVKTKVVTLTLSSYGRTGEGIVNKFPSANASG